ncbi:MAG: ABC transporter ATP-binding protein [Lachnospiraceae bacterium]|nr:ABC transporter ATP-binding protein/permease [Lachnospiraceae bacterium]MDY4837861.1 ABC transporter ATP-binding protein [Lachnospiraceae bacterium]
MPRPGGHAASIAAKSAPKVKNPGKILKRIFSMIFEKYSIHVIVVLICVLLNTYASIQGTLFTKTLIDDYIAPMLLKSSPDFAPLLSAIIRIAIIYLLGVGASFLQQKLMIYVAQGTLLRIREKIFSSMEKLPIKFFDTHSHGDIMSIYTNDVDTLRQLISQSLVQLVSSVVTICWTFVTMIMLSVPLTIVTCIMIALTMIASGQILKRSGENFVKQQKSIGQLNGFVEEMMTGQKVVKVFCHEQENTAEFNELNENLFISAYNANKFANSMGPISSQLGNLSYVMCAVVGGILALSTNSALTVGAVASFLALNKSFTMPINQVANQFNSIIMALAGAERVFNLMDEEPEKDEGYVELVNAKIVDGRLVETDERTDKWAWKHIHQADGSIDLVPLEGDVVLDTVDFSYTGDKLVLEDVSVYAHAGQKIAFVGSTGAGKTTITNLINRFYDIQDGKIRYDGINVNKIKKGDLRRSLGMVLQDTHLFTGTVMENIRYGRLDATDEEVINAAKIANADSFIDRLPDGYNTVLTGDGGNLSQGQRQLLSIARAAVANPPALILDEATSSIDTRTEKIVQAGMDNLMKGRSTFVIAHRLSTIKNADCIVVLEHGKIIEKGSHDELMEKKGKYYRLYTGNSITA